MYSPDPPDRWHRRPSPPDEPSSGAPQRGGGLLLTMILAGAAAVLFGASPRKRVFVSYDHDEDAHYRDLLRAWDRNPKFDFKFDLTSPVAAIQSKDAATVKRALTPKLKKAEYLLVLVGPRTAQSRWINWEIERATDSDVNLKIAAIRLKPRYRAPEALKGIGAAWATGFSVENVRKVLAAAQPARR